MVSFGRAFGVGLLITIVATSCYVATWEVVYYKLSPDFGEKFAAAAAAQARASGASEAAIAQRLQEVAEFRVQYDKPLVNIAYTFLEPLPVGLLFTVLTAWLISRKRRDGAVA